MGAWEGMPLTALWPTVDGVLAVVDLEGRRGFCLFRSLAVLWEGRSQSGGTGIGRLVGWLVGWWAGRTAKGDSIFETCRLPLSLVMDLLSTSCTQHSYVLTSLHILLQKIKALWRFGFWFPWGDGARGRVVGGGYVQSEQARESGLMMMIHPMPWLLLKAIQLWLYCTILDIPNERARVRGLIISTSESLETANCTC